MKRDGKFLRRKFNFRNDLYGASSAMKHGSPEDRGSADAYYQRRRAPHFYIGKSITGIYVPMSEMTQAQINSYNLGYDNEDDKKDYG